METSSNNSRGVDEKRSGLIVPDSTPKNQADSLVFNNHSSLDPKHFQEWLDSGVDPDFIRQNVKTIRGQEAVSSFLNIPPKRYYAYQPTFSGGWVCGNNFKPDNPRRSRGRVIKYEFPIEQTPEPLLLEPTEKIIQAIAIDLLTGQSLELIGNGEVEA